MFQDIIKSDALRRGKSIRPAPANPATSWMSAGVSQPPPNMDQLLQVLGTQPGMTPELLRQILEDRKQKMAVQPILPPGQTIAAANYRNPL